MVRKRECVKSDLEERRREGRVDAHAAFRASPPELTFSEIEELRILDGSFSLRKILGKEIEIISERETKKGKRKNGLGIACR